MIFHYLSNKLVGWAMAILLLGLVVLSGWFGIRHYKNLYLKECADRKADATSYQLQLSELKAGINLTNSEINQWKAAATQHATDLAAEKRVQEVKLAEARKEVERLKSLPLPEDPNEFRLVTDPILIDLAKGWTR